MDDKSADVCAISDHCVPYMVVFYVCISFAQPRRTVVSSLSKVGQVYSDVTDLFPELVQRQNNKCAGSSLVGSHTFEFISVLLRFAAK